VTDETSDEAAPEAAEESGITGSDPGWTDDLLERARERSAGGGVEPTTGPGPDPESEDVGAEPPLVAERPSLVTRAGLEGGDRRGTIPLDETFVVPVVPQPPSGGTPPAAEAVDLGIPGGGAGARRALLEWGSVIVGALLLAVVVRTFLFGAYYIPSPSMEPTLSAGDRIIVNKVSYRLHDVNRGDLVVFSPTGRASADGIDDLIKRVIALPGETVSLDAGRVIIDGGLLLEPYLTAPDVTDGMVAVPGCTGSTSGACTVPADHVFVMGDNRDNSRDSRFFGPVPIDSIAGRAFIRVWPLGSLDRL